MTVVRFTRGAVTRTKLVEALDQLGVTVGEDFVVAKAQDAEANQLGPHTRGSSTSRDAALDNFPRSGTQRRSIAMTIGRLGEHGATRDELASMLHLPDSSTDARVCELKRGGFVRETDRVRLTRAGSKASVLVLTDEGRARYEVALRIDGDE